MPKLRAEHYAKHFSRAMANLRELIARVGWSDAERLAEAPSGAAEPSRVAAHYAEAADLLLPLPRTGPGADAPAPTRLCGKRCCGTSYPWRRSPGSVRYPA